MRYLTSSIVGLALLACGLSLSLAADSEGFIRLQPEQVPFKNQNGIEQILLFGDPTKPGLYVVRIRFSPGMHSNPHYHSQDRHITVIKGVWYMGTGDKADFNSAVPLKTGSYAYHPAHAMHWDGAGAEEAIVQIIGMGPVETVQADAKLAPFGQWAISK